VVEERVGHRGSSGSRKFGFGVYGGGGRIAITHVGVRENIEDILSLGEV
jgi:hypothetical protein